MSNKPYHYQAPFPLKKDDTEYYLLTSENVSESEFEGQEILKVAPEALTLLARQAFLDASFMLRPAHPQQVADILRDPEASENDKYVALLFLRNSDNAAKGVLPTCQFMLRPAHPQQVADILRDPEASENDKYVALLFLRNSDNAAKGVLPTCQDTGTAFIVCKKVQRVWTGGCDDAALARGVYNTYIEDNLRYSQNAPLDMYKEVNTGTNLPAQIDLYAVDGPAKMINMWRCNSCVTPTSRQKAFCQPVRIPAPRLLLVKKGSVYGPVVVMKRRWRAVSITLISKIICATRKTRRWICIKK